MRVSRKSPFFPRVSMRFPREMWRQALGTTLGGRRTGSFLDYYHFAYSYPPCGGLWSVKAGRRFSLRTWGSLTALGGIGGVLIVHLCCLCVRGQATGLICWVSVSSSSKLAGTSIVTWHSNAHEPDRSQPKLWEFSGTLSLQQPVSLPV